MPKIEDTGDLELAPKGWAQKVKAVDPRATDVSLGMKENRWAWPQMAKLNPGRVAGGYVGGCIFESVWGLVMGQSDGLDGSDMVEKRDLTQVTVFQDIGGLVKYNVNIESIELTK